MYPSIAEKDVSIEEILAMTSILDMRREENFEIKKRSKESCPCVFGKVTEKNLDVSMLNSDQKPYNFQFLVKIDTDMFDSEEMKKQREIIMDRVQKINKKIHKRNASKAIFGDESNSQTMMGKRSEPSSDSENSDSSQTTASDKNSKKLKTGNMHVTVPRKSYPGRQDYQGFISISENSEKSELEKKLSQILVPKFKPFKENKYAKCTKGKKLWINCDTLFWNYLCKGHVNSLIDQYLEELRSVALKNRGMARFATEKLKLFDEMIKREEIYKNERARYKDFVKEIKNCIEIADSDEYSSKVAELEQKHPYPKYDKYANFDNTAASQTYSFTFFPDERSTTFKEKVKVCFNLISCIQEEIPTKSKVCYDFEKSKDNILLEILYNKRKNKCINSIQNIGVDALTEFVQNNLIRKIRMEKAKILCKTKLCPGLARDGVRSCQNLINSFLRNPKIEYSGFNKGMNKSLFVQEILTGKSRNKLLEHNNRNIVEEMKELLAEEKMEMDLISTDDSNSEESQNLTEKPEKEAENPISKKYAESSNKQGEKTSK